MLIEKHTYRISLDLIFSSQFWGLAQFDLRGLDTEQPVSSHTSSLYDILISLR